MSATIQPWHREAAKEIHPWNVADEGLGTIEDMQEGYDENEANMKEDNRIAQIIAAHDPAAADRELLKECERALDSSRGELLRFVNERTTVLMQVDRTLDKLQARLQNIQLPTCSESTEST